jgi:uncharacterized protein (TIGR02996 family)
MTAPSQLLTEIWQRPTDRQLLSVYADWLATHGETTRAEYVQLSLLDRRTAAQDRRRSALCKRYRGTWLGAARPFVHTWEDSDETPGFVSQARCSMARLAAGFELVRALGPRLVVSVSEPKAKREVTALAAHPLGSLYGLALWESDAQWITDELLATLAPSLRGLRSLILYPGEARSSDVGWQAVLAHADALERLELAMGANPERWLELVLDSALTRTLRTLSVPAWIGEPLRARLARELPGCTLELRDERRNRFDTATGFYE